MGNYIQMLRQHFLYVVNNNSLKVFSRIIEFYAKCRMNNVFITVQNADNWIICERYHWIKMHNWLQIHFYWIVCERLIHWTLETRIIILNRSRTKGVNTDVWFIVNLFLLNHSWTIHFLNFIGSSLNIESFANEIITP